MKISIITAVYNREKTIERAMESVLAQDYADIEYIVVDGASKDGTMNVVRSMEPKFNGRLRYVSEPDKGIYDAMNKGVRMATGDVVAILNSDDFYHNRHTLSEIAVAFETDPELKVVYGDNIWVTEREPKKIIRYANGNNWGWFAARCGVMPPHATFFVKKECFEKYGYYDTSYKICADFKKEAEFLVVHKLKSRYLGFPFMTMVTGGASTAGAGSYWTSIKECHRACKELGLFTCWPMQFLKLFIKLPQMFNLNKSGNMKNVVGLVILGWLLWLPSGSLRQPHYSGVERLDRFGARCITFDATGGQCTDSIRYVKVGGSYGENMNVYPSESSEHFIAQVASCVNTESGLMAIALMNEGKDNQFANYMTRETLPIHTEGTPWTYVADVTHFRGQLGRWAVGQTSPTNRECYAQLSYASLGTNVVSGAKIFRTLKSTGWDRFNYLDRAYLCAKPGQSFAIEFRVALFAGTSVNAANYHYVKPGETLPAPLPIPDWPGHEFMGWYDEDRLVTDATIVEKSGDHALKARWK